MKRINRMLLVATAVLAPLAARADLVGPWSPPNNYEGFLYRNGYCFSSISILLGGCFFGIFAIAVFIGCCVLTWVFCRLRGRRMPSIKTRFAMALGISAVVGAVAFSIRSFREGFSIMSRVVSESGHSPPAAFSHLRDTPSHRAEYDKYCIDWYDNWEPQGKGITEEEYESLPRYRNYREGWIRRNDNTFIRDPKPPTMRDAASEAVTNAYSRFRAKLHGGGEASSRQGAQSDWSFK